eukprot:CAMPEP_0168800488 /NCGR_PEP_ID=MMETSP0725-20121227/19034_1 /TAXON_ID=265536 /ORGANISM="Amphiprora sp., Strain CCMP467" /LENGTH=40 /DNA_ID= /DNA_START= /DNA_END= /DNA_ORIENTATION=
MSTGQVPVAMRVFKTSTGVMSALAKTPDNAPAANKPGSNL